MPDGPVLKHVPQDFLVRESMVVQLCPQAEASQHYLLLRKCGYTTMEAVRLLAGRLGLTTAEVTYGGLKDEDGITEQLVAVPAGAAPPEVGNGGWWTGRGTPRWIQLQHYGHGTDPLQIGRLEGNGFRVVVRNLDAAAADRFAGLRKLTAVFLNYYDTQRFGVPGGPKRTHLVGAAILDRRWDDALRELAGLRAPESAAAAAWDGPAERFFADLDPRTTAFYLAAHSSDGWNAALRSSVAQLLPGQHVPVVVDGITYDYLSSPVAALRLMAELPELPYDRYSFVAGEPVRRASVRTTAVQTSIAVEEPRPEQSNAGRYSVELAFFLPSGCYATAALRQVLTYARPDRTPGGNGGHARADSAVEKLLDRVRGATTTRHPWTHAYLEQALPADLARQLGRSFDEFELTECERIGTGKSYRFATTRLRDGTRLPAPGWEALVKLLRGPQYRAAMSELTGVQLDGSDFTIDLWEYRTGDWLAPHVDKPEKLVTQLFYLSEDWTDGDGGRLLILENAEPASVSVALAPRLGSSAVLVRSDHSWHAVEAPAPGVRRRSITATFWRAGTGEDPAQVPTGTDQKR